MLISSGFTARDTDSSHSKAPYRATLFEDVNSSFPAITRSRLCAKRKELYKARANSAGNGGTDSFNDDDIYGESVTAPTGTNTAKDEPMEADASPDDEYEGPVDAWLCTCSEQGVIKVSLHCWPLHTSLMPTALRTIDFCPSGL